MKIVMFFLLVGFFVISLVPIYAEQNYIFEIDEHTFDVSYNLDGNIIAMAIDPELTSLLVGTENVKDSIFSISLSQELINSENNEFAILVSGLEVDYSIEIDDDTSKLTFLVPEGTEEIEIIGTHVIPEFPLTVFFIFAIAIILVPVFTKLKIS